MKIPIIYNIRSLIQRPATTLATALGIAFVVLTFVAMLALANGFRAALVSTGRPDNALVLRTGADSEITSGISREHAAILRSYPEIRHMADGRPMASSDIYVVVSKPRSNGTETNMPVRGVGPEATDVRDQVRITNGRMFEPGRAEVIVGSGFVGRMQNTAIGDVLRFGQQDFEVVGHFEADGGAFESEVWGDAETLMSIFRGPVFQSVVMRLEDSTAFDRLKARIEGDPRLQVEVERESQFFADQAGLLTTVLRFVAIFVTAIMAVGAVFGAINTMDAMVAARGREIALLRTLGFRRRSIMTSFLAESLLVAFAGGVLGVLFALPINGIQTSTTNWQSFSEISFAFRVTPASMLAGIVFALVMGLVGGMLPAWRAARANVAVGLRKQ